MRMKETKIIPVHQWTNGGNEVLVVRFVTQDGKSYGGFQHPMIIGETVTAPDWEANCKCGGGIHAWAWALGLGVGKNCDWTALWQVYGVKPEDIMQGEPDLIGKIKFHTGVLRFIGKWWEATNFVLAGQMAWVHHSARGSASSTGERGSASSAGESGSASSTGWSGSASSAGESGSASSTGWSGSASSTGESGSASSTGARGSASSTGWSGSASSTGARGSASSSGKYGTACSFGIEGKASGSVGNFIILAEWKYADCTWKRIAIGMAKVDGKKIKADTFYTLKDGKFVEATQLGVA
jgi:hypothetical protein